MYSGRGLNFLSTGRISPFNGRTQELKTTCHYPNLGGQSVSQALSSSTREKMNPRPQHPLPREEGPSDLMDKKICKSLKGSWVPES